MSLKVGDTIKCHDKDEMVEINIALEIENIHTDFMYEKDGKRGLWLVVTSTEPVETMTVEEVKTAMCDDYCKYTHTHQIYDMQVVCGNCPLRFLED